MATKPVDINNAPPSGFREGGWYWDPSIKQARQYIGGNFGGGTTIADPNAVGYGQKVSPEVQAASGYVAPPTPPTQPTPATPPASTVPATTPASPGQATITGPGTNMPNATGAPVVPQLQDVYDTALRGAGYDTAVAAVDAAQQKVNDVTAANLTETNKINENPFLSEGTRQGKVARLNKIADAEIQKEQNNLVLAQGKVAQAQADAKLKVDLANGQYSLNRQTYQDNLSTFNTLLTNGALNGANAVDVANFSNATGIPSSMIQSAIAMAKQKNANTELVTSTNDAGVVTTTLINKDTNTIIKQTSLGAIGNAQKGAAATEKYAKDTDIAIASDALAKVDTNDDGMVSKEEYAQARAIVYSQIADPAIAASALNTASGAYKRWNW